MAGYAARNTIQKDKLPQGYESCLIGGQRDGWNNQDVHRLDTEASASLLDSIFDGIPRSASSIKGQRKWILTHMVSPAWIKI